MRSVLQRLVWVTVGIVAIAFFSAAGITYWKYKSEIDPVPDEQKLARSLEIIRTSTPQDRKVLKVLFYGQSITASGWDKSVIEHWHARYPNTIFVVENKALGGWSSKYLVRAAERDVTEFYPDLIVFHVYGDHRAYEQILRIIRSHTAADFIVQTDHSEGLADPPCREGLQLTLRRPQGCKGFGWLDQENWSDRMSYHILPSFAKKYGLGLEPQRLWWRNYLLQTHVDPRSLLKDNIHPNAAGKALLAAFFNQYFDHVVDAWSGQQEPFVTSIPPDVPQHTDTSESIHFDGNRLELLSAKPLAALPSVLIDGVSPQQTDGCYQTSRASSIGSVPEWPTVRQIDLKHDQTPEQWTATLTNISADQRTFNFTVSGSVSGDQGSGTSAADFVSRSGKVTIAAEDWMLERAFFEKHIPLHDPFIVRWTVSYVCGDTPEVIDRGGSGMQYRYTLATGLTNTSHTADLSYPAGDLIDLTEFRAYRPPLR